MRTQDHFNDTIIAPACRSHSLPTTRNEAVQPELAATAPEWMIDQHDAYDCNMTIMLTPLQVDLGSPSFVLNGTYDGVRLDVIQDDSFQDLAMFKTPASAIRHLQRIMANRTDIQHVSATQE